MRIAVKVSEAIEACKKAIDWYQNYEDAYKEFFIQQILNIGTYTTYKFLWFGKQIHLVTTREQAEALINEWKIRYTSNGKDLQIIPAESDLFYDDSMAGVIKRRYYLREEIINKLDKQILTLSASSMRNCCLSDDENPVFLNFLTGFEPKYKFKLMQEGA